MTKKERVTKQILGVLRGVEASRIRFTFPNGSGNITISARTFRDVAQAVEQGDIDVDPDATLPPGVGALYSGRKDTISIAAAVVGREQFGVLLHECTHAWFDMKMTAIRMVDEEAAAYVVDALYYRMSGLAKSRRDDNEPFWFADQVAVGLLKQAGTRGIPAVDAINWNLLRATIVTDSTYVGKAASYPHNGLYRPALRAMVTAARNLKSAAGL